MRFVTAIRRRRGRGAYGSPGDSRGRPRGYVRLRDLGGWRGASAPRGARASEQQVRAGRSYKGDEDLGGRLLGRMRIGDTDAVRHQYNDVVVVTVVPETADPARIRWTGVREGPQRHHRAEQEKREQARKNHRRSISLRRSACQALLAADTSPERQEVNLKPNS